jgi:hypothetical protein
MTRPTYIPAEPASEPYLAALPAAGAHLHNFLAAHAQVGEIMWLRTADPFHCHIEIRLGTQRIFVRLEGFAAPGSRQLLARIATQANGHALVMPMHVAAGRWRPVLAASGLVPLAEAQSPWRARIARLLRAGRPFDLVALRSDLAVELTDWEVHENAIDAVCQMLRGEGKTIVSRHPDPAVDPAIWYEGGQGREWMIVRAVRHPQPEAPCPPAEHVAEVAAVASRFSSRGSFVSVLVANEDEAQPRLLRGGRGAYHISRRVPLPEAPSPPGR